MESPVTSTTVIGPVAERLQPGTEDAPVLDRRRHMRRLHDSGAGYNYLDLLTYLLTLAFVMYLVLEVININCKTTAFITTVENFLLLHE